MIGKILSYWRLGVLCCGLVLLAGCSSATPTTRYYLLSDPGGVQSSPDQGCDIRLGAITVAPYLQRTHIMLQTGTNELVPALQHRWSEPLEAGVGRLLGNCLGGGTQASQQASVHIDHLHGNTQGSVVLQAHWTLKAADAAAELSVPSDGRFSAQSPQETAGYDALVSTQRQLVLQLCADIRATLASCR